MELVFISNGRHCKVTNEVRLGLAYESSTWYNLSDEFSKKLIAVSSNVDGDLLTRCRWSHEYLCALQTTNAKW
jgi:hypothetical protein